MAARRCWWPAGSPARAEARSLDSFPHGPPRASLLTAPWLCQVRTSRQRAGGSCVACYDLTSQIMSRLFRLILLVKTVTKAAQFQGDLWMADWQGS